MFLENLFRRQPKRFSSEPLTTSFAMIGGTIIGENPQDAIREIKKNICIKSIVSKQASIISEATLEIREYNENGQDNITTNPDALKFLDFINSPNTYPAPTTRKHVFEHLISGYWTEGISCLVFEFNGSIQMKNFNRTIFAYDFNYNETSQEIRVNFNVSDINDKTRNDTQIKFVRNKYNLFTTQTNNKSYVLFMVSDLNRQSPFIEYIDYIILNNILISYNKCLFSNFKVPAVIVSVSYRPEFLTDNPNPLADETTKKSFEEKIAQIKSAFTNNVEQAKQMFLSDPNLQVEVKTLSLPSNSDETKTLWELSGDALFAIVDGGSRSGYQGLNDYSGNTLTKQKEVYDGAFRIAESLISDSITNFLRKLLMTAGSSNFTKIFADFNTTSVEVYRKDRLKEGLEIWNNNGCKLNEYRNILRNADDAYADFQDLEDIGNKLQVEIKGEQTRANFNTMNKVSEPAN